MSVCFQALSSVASEHAWSTQPFTGFCLDSRKLQAGQIFIALTSLSQPEKTVEFAQNALANGALAVLSEEALDLPNCVYVPDLRQQLGHWQQQYLQHTTGRIPLPIIAVTGTNGKTTISRLVAELLSLAGLRCAVMGTTGNGILPELTPSTHTTLDALQVQNALFDYAAQGAQFAALEASSHGLHQGRLNGCDIQVAIYSNLSRDHLDYHGSFEAYAAAKAQLFAFATLNVAIINADDAHAHIMLDAAQGNPSHPKILTYACVDAVDAQAAATATPADFIASDLQFDVSGTRFQLDTPEGQFAVQSPFLGRFNVENVLASIIAAQAVGLDLATIIAHLPQLQGAPGRMQVLRDAERLFVVDYAHTPDALEQVLKTLKHHVNNQLWVVFGCGGDRDRGKRPLMTQVALDHADQVLLTLDNPRSEDPKQIFADMCAVDVLLSSSSTHLQIDDRRAAIRHAVQQAKAGDIVLIAGKGHENYQEILGVRHWFDDVVELQAAIEAQYHRPNQAYPAQ